MTKQEYARNYRENNKEYLRNYRQNYRKNNRDKFLDYSRKYTRENSQKINERKRVSWQKGDKAAQSKIIFQRRLRLKYKLTANKYETLVSLQQGKCAICGNFPIKGRLAVDHCHVTNRVRGLLCFKCNAGIGLLNDSVEFLGKAITYLKKGR